MSFRIRGVDPKPYIHLFGMSELELLEHSTLRYIVDKVLGFPDRIKMRDGKIGETMLLISFKSQRATHPVFVRE